MKLKTLKTLALALAGTAILATTASAQLTYTSGDLFLDFQATSGSAAANNFEVDLGPATNAAFASGVVNLNTLLTATQLNEISSLSSASNGTLVWSLVSGGAPGHTSGTSNIFDISQNVGDTAVTLGSATAAGAAGNARNIGAGASSNAATTVDSNSITIASADGGGNSYTEQLADIYPSTGINNPETLYSPGSELILYSYAPHYSGALAQGNAVTSTLATFEFAAAPEPSTYVLMLGGLLALVALKRRNSTSTL